MMRIRTASMVMAVLSLLLAAGAILITIISLKGDGPYVPLDEDMSIAPPMLLVGWFLAFKKPGHPVAFALLCVSLGVTSTVFTDRYLVYAGLKQPDLPLQSLMATLYSTTWTLIVGGFLLICLFFPNGTFQSKFWQVIARLIVPLCIGISLFVAFSTVTLEEPYEELRSPLGTETLDAFRPFLTAMDLALLTCAVLAVGNLFYRFWRSRGEERQQFRLLAFSAVVAIITTVISGMEYAYKEEVGNTLQGISFIGIPISIGVAVMRYHLYDIDRLINRTIVYGLLTAGLGAVYFGLVVGLQELLRPLSGGSDLAIVLTTLVVAALFMPARSKVQAVVDRRFNRRQYDATRTVDAFSARLREQIELDSLRYELLSVIDETMAPTASSLWLRTRTAEGMTHAPVRAGDISALAK